MNVDEPWLLILIAVIAVLGAIGIWFLYRKRESERLRHHYGPEYDRAVSDLGDRARAEAELKAREKRVEKLHIVPLDPKEAARFSESWRAVQARFVDDPKRAVTEADGLLRDVMARRGYPVTDFEGRAADLSVHYSHLVDNYRRARDIAAENERGSADTEKLRQALVYYRELFDELLETRVTTRSEQPKHAEVRT